MGLGSSFSGAAAWEAPLLWAPLTRPFYLGKYEVTQARWVAVMGDNPSEFKGDANPVETASWDDAQDFLKRLT
jgi:formylglycine-generating enzyme required for sulfatase activity